MHSYYGVPYYGVPLKGLQSSVLGYPKSFSSSKLQAKALVTAQWWHSRGKGAHWEGSGTEEWGGDPGGDAATPRVPGLPELLLVWAEHPLGAKSSPVGDSQLLSAYDFHCIVSFEGYSSWHLQLLGKDTVLIYLILYSLGAETPKLQFRDQTQPLPSRHLHQTEPINK